MTIYVLPIIIVVIRSLYYHAIYMHEANHWDHYYLMEQTIHIGVVFSELNCSRHFYVLLFEFPSAIANGILLLFALIWKLHTCCLWCPMRTRYHEHTTLYETSIALGSRDYTFCGGNEKRVLYVFTLDFSLHTDLVSPQFIYSLRIWIIFVWIIFVKSHMAVIAADRHLDHRFKNCYLISAQELLPNIYYIKLDRLEGFVLQIVNFGHIQ